MATIVRGRKTPAAEKWRTKMVLRLPVKFVVDFWAV